SGVRLAAHRKPKQGLEFLDTGRRLRPYHPVKLYAVIAERFKARLDLDDSCLVGIGRYGLCRRRIDLRPRGRSGNIGRRSAVKNTKPLQKEAVYMARGRQVDALLVSGDRLSGLRSRQAVD